MNTFRNKKGFGLVECVVALLLFSIIVASVLSIFSSSRNQIKKQNDEFKSTLIQNNIISAYQASNNFANMANILGWTENQTPTETPTVPVSGGSGNGTIPVQIPFGKITVDGGCATFKKQDTDPENGALLDTYTSLISFEGDYEYNNTNNRLPAEIIDRNSDGNSTYYNENKITQPKRMVLTGTAHTALQAGNLTTVEYTITMDDDCINLNMGANISKPTTQLDKYLLDNGYFLQGARTCEYSCELSKSDENGKKPLSGREYYKTDYTVYENLYFQVFSASSKQPIENNNNNLFYLVSFPAKKETIDLEYDNVKNLSVDKIIGYLEKFNFLDLKTIEISSFGDKILDYYGNNDSEYNPKTYISLNECKIKTFSGRSCPSYNSFTADLEAPDEYDFSKGNWYFVPWLAYRNGSDYEPECSEYFSGKIYYEYTPKSGKASNIYYVLNKDGEGEVKLFDSNSVNIFTFNGDEDKANSSLDGAQRNCGITNSTTSNDYNVWYKQGYMQEKEIKKIEFNDDTKEIIIYNTEGTNGTPFIRFLYNGTKYNEDKNSVKGRNGVYKSYFNGDGTIKERYKGKIFFSCASFGGPYTIKIGETVIFKSNAQNFEIIGALPKVDGAVSYGVIGEPINGLSGTAEAKVYYVRTDISGSNLSLVSKITFCDLAIPKRVGEETVEPQIEIWSINTNVLNRIDIKTIATSLSATKVRTYRKG